MARLSRIFLCTILSWYLLFSLSVLVSARRRGHRRRSKTTQSTCEDIFTREPKMCQPDLVDAAINKTVTATSTCGKVPTTLCVHHDRAGNVCYHCNEKSKHPASHITDRQHSFHKTCWISEPFKGPSKDVSLFIPIGKLYEINFIAIEFCNRIPDSLAIYKSMDGGENFIPFHYFSTDCLGVYNIPENRTITMNQLHAPLCKAPPRQRSKRYDRRRKKTDRMLDFSTTAGRPGAAKLDDLPVLREWITLTHLRIDFKHLYPPHSLPRKEDSHYAVANLEVVGRCKCNGHASHCVVRNGKEVCDCRHNTRGPDCSQCLPFHHNVPWSRPTPSKPHQCVSCDCNGHSNRCHFDKSQYHLSGNKLGGVCDKCRHNTAGKQCQYCQSYYSLFRKERPTVTIRDPNACKPCECHVVGTLPNKPCHPESGQCPCKPNLQGLRCEACATGYIQTKNATAATEHPCEADPEHPLHKPKYQHTEPHRPRDRRRNSTDDCPSKCLANERSLRSKRLCRRFIVTHIRIGERRRASASLTRFSVKIIQIFKGQSWMKLGRQSIYVKRRHLKCDCPRLNKGHDYLILARPGNTNKNYVTYHGRKNLSLDNKAIVIPWRDEFARKMLRKVSSESEECRPANPFVHNYN